MQPRRYDGRVLLKIALCSALVAGCTHHRPLSRAFDEVEGGRQVTVQTTSGTLSAVTVSTGTGIGYQAEGGGMIDPSVIVRVTDTRGLRGAGEGFLIGTGIGAGVGVVLGLADGDDPPCADGSWCLFNMSAGEKAILGGIMLGSIGSLVGVAIGAVSGSEVIYENSESFSITPGGPPGSVAGATITF